MSIIKYAEPKDSTAPALPTEDAIKEESPKLNELPTAQECINIISTTKNDKTLSLYLIIALDIYGNDPVIKNNAQIIFDKMFEQYANGIGDARYFINKAAIIKDYIDPSSLVSNIAKQQNIGLLSRFFEIFNNYDPNPYLDLLLSYNGDM